MSKSTKIPAERTKTTPQPWESWATTARYLVICVGLAVLCAVLAWLAGVFH